MTKPAQKAGFFLSLQFWQNIKLGLKIRHLVHLCKQYASNVLQITFH